MSIQGEYFAAAETPNNDGGAPPPVFVYRGAEGLLAAQLAEALDNHELLEGNWELVHTYMPPAERKGAPAEEKGAPAEGKDGAAAAPTERKDAGHGGVLDELAADASVHFTPGERQQVGRWSIVQLADFGFLHKT
ncbi:hypothetical protein [Arthrobacter sp. VKM Ac-2550]|uniref:hypothetical protein n=1 Tax=Crystallibacter permensis TaxID=1938888 RepID=UPI002225F04D|nr:hypothetical protein [Arthrobacter sp. VKM Ac-2550]MCW2134419.1 hypothetical protein [Arthrobacter sp. VKM Ac-2550]